MLKILADSLCGIILREIDELACALFFVAVAPGVALALGEASFCRLGCSWGFGARLFVVAEGKVNGIGSTLTIG